MDEARRVLERLERIEALRGDAGEPQSLLAELRALIAEGEAWIAAEGAGTARAEHTLMGLRVALGTTAAGGEEEAAPTTT